MSRRPLVLLGLACASAAAAFAVWLVAFVVPGGRALDARALQTFAGVARPPLTPSVNGIALLADPLPFAIGAAVLVALALLRRRWLMAATVPVILLAANYTTQALKPALGDLRVVDVVGAAPGIYPGSWPSGHATASMSLALCLVLVSGQRLRSLAAMLGASYAIAVGYSLVVLGFHLPSDVFGGYLVAATFTLLGASALAALEARQPERVARMIRPPVRLSVPGLAAVAAVVVVLAAVALEFLRPGTPADILQRPVAVLAGVGIAGLGLALTTGLAHVLRR